MTSWLNVFDRSFEDEYSNTLSSLLKQNGFLKDKGDNFSSKLYSEYIDSISKYLPDSVYDIHEIGCGNGLFITRLAEKLGIKSFGGSDISGTQIRRAQRINPTGCFSQKEAIDDKTNADFILANSVFQYFPTQEYAQQVIVNLLQNSSKGIAVLDIPETSQEYEYRSRGFVGNNEIFHLAYSRAWFETTIENSFRKHYRLQILDQTRLPYHQDTTRFNVYLYHC